MELLTPDLGLFIWTFLVFLIVLGLLSKFAWKPISSALKNREQSIEDALNEASKAREEMNKLKAENDQLVKEAKQERDQILKEARETRDKMVDDAKDEARKESQQMIENAKQSIEKEREKAFAELKGEVADIAMDVAAKILRKELSNKQDQEKLVEEYIQESNLN